MADLKTAFAEASALREASMTAGTGSSSSELFGAGLASLASGSALPIAGAAIKYLLGRTPPKVRMPKCVVDHNPSGENFDAIKARDQRAGFVWGYAAREEIPVDQLGPLQNCVGEPPKSCQYTFDEWNRIVDSFDPVAMSFEVQTRHKGQISGDTYFTESHDYEHWARVWMAMNAGERRRRYDAEAEACAVDLLKSGLSGPEKAQLETHLGGRFKDGSWKAAGDSIMGRRVSGLPRWVPTDSADESLASEYLLAWDSLGITDQDMEAMSENVDPGALVSTRNIEKMGPKERRKFIAIAHALAAANAKGHGPSYLRAKEFVDSFARDVGVEPYSITSQERVDAWKALDRATIQYRSAALGLTPSAGPSTLIGPIVAIASGLVVGIIVIVRHRRNRRRK